jgi:hypothetical protein
MKPLQKGRIILDPRGSGGAGAIGAIGVVGGVAGAGGKNVGREETHLPTLLPHAPPVSSSRGPTKRMYSLDMSTDYLNSKQPKPTSEVELENMRLKKLLQEAELSIKSYKSFLSQKSSLNNQNISTQTEIFEVENEDERIENQRKVLEMELQEMKRENLMLRNQITLLQRNQNKVTEDYEQRILELEQNLQVFQSKKVEMKTTTSTTMTPKKARPVVQKLRRNEVNHKMLIVSELNDFNELLCRNLDLIRSRISSMAPVAAPAASTSPKKSGYTSPLKAIPIDHGCGPMTPISSTDRGHDPPTPSSLKLNGNGNGNGWHVTPILEQQPNPSSNALDSGILSLNTDIESHVEYQELQSQLHIQTMLVESLSERLTSAHKSVHGSLITKFGNEIHAIKHWAHCKELVRIAALRELGLEKDRLMNELKYSK